MSLSVEKFYYHVSFLKTHHYKIGFAINKKRFSLLKSRKLDLAYILSEKFCHSTDHTFHSSSFFITLQKLSLIDQTINKADWKTAPINLDYTTKGSSVYFYIAVYLREQDWPHELQINAISPHDGYINFSRCRTLLSFKSLSPPVQQLFALLCKTKFFQTVLSPIKHQDLDL